MSNAILNSSKFIHIPKCGGTAVQTALWRLGLIKDKSQVFTSPHHGHLFASQMPVDNRFNFTFVRNPISWYQSWYNWNMQQPLSRFSGEELKTKSFDQWVDEYGQFWLGIYGTLIKRYFGEDENFPTSNKMQFVGKVENLYNDLGRALDAAGETYDANILRDLQSGAIQQNRLQTNRQAYDRTSISNSSIELIYKVELATFNRFHYGPGLIH